jgi:serine/threonine protein kinase
LAVYDEDAVFCSEDGAELRQAEDKFLGKTIASRYRLIKRLGQGGMSVVYLARHVIIDRLSALKILRPDYGRSASYRERFLREAKAVNRINHRNIVEITDVGESDGVAYLVMEYVSGESLLAHIQRGVFPWLRAVAIATQIASALSRAHQQGVIHRDLKPENIILVPDADVEPLSGTEERAIEIAERSSAWDLLRQQARETVKLTDFGIAKLVDLPAITFTEQLFGTPGYIAPEYVEGKDADARADIYSLGIMLYEMITGALPFEGKGQADLLLKPLMTDPRPPSAHGKPMPPELEALIMRMIARDPTLRPPDALAVHDQLIRIGVSAEPNFAAFHALDDDEEEAPQTQADGRFLNARGQPRERLDTMLDLRVRERDGALASGEHAAGGGVAPVVEPFQLAAVEHVPQPYELVQRGALFAPPPAPESVGDEVPATRVFVVSAGVEPVPLSMPPASQAPTPTSGESAVPAWFSPEDEATHLRGPANPGVANGSVGGAPLATHTVALQAIPAQGIDPPPRRSVLPAARASVSRSSAPPRTSWLPKLDAQRQTWASALADLDASIARAEQRGALPPDAALRARQLAEHARAVVPRAERATRAVAEAQDTVDMLQARARDFRGTLGHAIDSLLRERSRERVRLEELRARRVDLTQSNHGSLVPRTDSALWEAAALAANEEKARAHDADLTYQIESLQRELGRRNEEVERELVECTGALEGALSGLRLVTSELLAAIEQATRAVSTSFSRRPRPLI